MATPRIEINEANVRHNFGHVVAEGVKGILTHQEPDGRIIFDAKAPDVYPQQAIMPLAFCWAGLDPDKRWSRSDEIFRCAQRLGELLVSRFDDEGRYSHDSYGYKVNHVDQRLTYAWTEGLRIFREAGADLPYAAWEKKLRAAAHTLIETRLRKLVGIRRFTVRVQGTSTNHVALYLTTVHRIGVVLNDPALCEFVMPIARAMALDIHPDGYWDEHSDLLRTGGPTPSYNYLTMCAIGLMAEWTGEPVFRAAADRASHFHMNFSCPDGRFCELLDERVRIDESALARHYHYDLPRIWGLFAMSNTPQGRAAAAQHLQQWIDWTTDLADVSPQSLARHCENYLYWRPGAFATPPTDNPNHSATMTLPAGVARRGAWFTALSAMAATTEGDPAYRENPFGLQRQKLFSLWHASAGVVIDGSHSKDQPENSTFTTDKHLQKPDYMPCGGSVSVGETLRVDAAYRTFTGSVVVKPINDDVVQIDFAVDPAGCPGPIVAGFTMPVRDTTVVMDSGERRTLEEDRFVLPGGFTHAGVHIAGPDDMKLHWPLEPFHSYSADHVASKGRWVLRVSFELTRERPSGSVRVTIRRQP